MKISVDDQELFTITETQKNVIKNDISADIFEEDMKRRLQYIINHKYEQCFKRLKEEWEPIFKKSGMSSIPLSDDAFASLVFAHPDYKSRKQKDIENSISHNDLHVSLDRRI